MLAVLSQVLDLLGTSAQLLGLACCLQKLVPSMLQRALGGLGLLKVDC